MGIDLAALVVASWARFHPGAEHAVAAREVSHAIAIVISEDIPRAWSREESAIVMGYYALRESWLRPDALGDGGRSCGVWQTPCATTRRLSVLEQARYWLRQVNAAGLASVDSSASRAQHRIVVARRLLAYLTRDDALPHAAAVVPAL